MLAKYQVVAESGVNFGAICVIGEGDTKDEAWFDALGPKPWNKYQMSLKKKYWLRENNEEKAYEQI